MLYHKYIFKTRICYVIKIYNNRVTYIQEKNNKYTMCNITEKTVRYKWKKNSTKSKMILCEIRKCLDNLTKLYSSEVNQTIYLKKLILKEKINAIS